MTVKQIRSNKYYFAACLVFLLLLVVTPRFISNIRLLRNGTEKKATVIHTDWSGGSGRYFHGFSVRLDIDGRQFIAKHGFISFNSQDGDSMTVVDGGDNSIVVGTKFNLVTWIISIPVFLISLLLSVILFGKRTFKYKGSLWLKLTKITMLVILFASGMLAILYQ